MRRRFGRGWAALAALWVVAAVACEAGGGGARREGPQTVALPDFALDPKRYAGQEVRLVGIKVASRLGQQAFWIELPNGVPYLIKLETPVSVQSGQLVDVQGMVIPMTDSVLSAWEQQGVIKGEGQKAEAQFATSFLEASRAGKS